MTTESRVAPADRGNLAPPDFARLLADEDRPATIWFAGHAFAVVGDLEPLRELFEVEGCAVIRTRRDAEGAVRLAMRQVTLYRDPATRALLQHWRNPYSDTEVAVRHEHLPAVQATLAGGTAVPWLATGARMAVFVDNHAAAHFPLHPASPASGRRCTSCAELTLRREHLHGADRDAPGFVGAWQLLLDWPEWLGMGAQPGYLFQRCFVRKLPRGGTLPGPLQEDIRARFADGLDPPTTANPAA